jgi:hypothetical protein
MNPQADPELLPLRMVYLTDRTLKPYLRGEITDNEANNLIHRSDGASMNYLDAKLKQLSRLDQKVAEDEHFGYRTGVLQYFPWPYSDFNGKVQCSTNVSISVLYLSFRYSHLRNASSMH